MSILAEILERKRAAVKRRREQAPLADFRGSLTPARRDLAAALQRPRTGLVLECKAASPSAGALRTDYDPAAIARAYAPFADAISVLCDEPFFGGRLEHLQAVRGAAPCPVLCKDFVVDPYQVYEARRYGAHGILLMLSVLDDDTWRACAAACQELHMTPLTEAHDEAELERALALEAPVIGINNRDLRTLEVDLGTTERLAPRVPPSRVLVCESGIGGHADLRRLRGQVDAFLVGSALMRAPDLERAVRQLAVGRLKICGLRRPEDAWIAWEAGATWGGLVFAPSRRRVTEGEAEQVQTASPRLRWVGVSVNDPPGWVARRASRLDLAAVQLHGDEDADYVTTLRPQLPTGCEIWKAQRVRSVAEVVPRPDVDRLLLDAHHPTLRGGTGETFDWRGLADHPEHHTWVLAGGLSPDNIHRAAAMGCWALDLSSGVEQAPGVKDPVRLTSLYNRLRGPGREVIP